MVKKTVTIRQALQHVVDNPVVTASVMLDVPAHELVARTLFEIANAPDLKNARSQSRANAARSMIFNRLVGKRRAGTHPATRRQVTLEFVDLTARQVGVGDE